MAGTMKSIYQEDVLVLEDGNDLSGWEFVNQSDADSDTESLHSLENGFLSWYSLTAATTTTTTNTTTPPKSDPETHTQNTLQVQDLVGLVNSYGDGQYNVEAVMFSDVDDQYRDDEEEDNDEDDDDDDEDGHGYGYGLDDELVPWHVTGKLGRQRMRKLGKRVFAKMGNSKRNPYLFVKPGCVYGKHGLGIKA